jgi:hypothetical protein
VKAREQLKVQADIFKIADGAIGSIGEAVGGPLSSEGMIGKQFTDKGAVGDAVQENLGSGKE